MGTIDGNRCFFTRSGVYIDPFCMPVDDIVLGDIAHSLSSICRFGGHTENFYSVATHSVYVSRQLEQHYVSDMPDDMRTSVLRWGLMHDAAEAYLGDIVSPVKNNMALYVDRYLEDYKDVENDVLGKIATRFSLPWPVPQVVKAADTDLLSAEGKRFVESDSSAWDLPGARPVSFEIESMYPPEGKALFIARYEELS